MDKAGKRLTSIIKPVKKGLVGVYLAAGSSKRMGTAKLSLEVAEGTRLGGLALLQALHSGLDSVVIVTKEGGLDWLPEEAWPHLRSGRCRMEVCMEAGRGMAHSLQTGIRAAEALKADGVLVMLADQPFVTASMLNRLVDVFRYEAGIDFVACGDAGVPKPPVVLGRSMWSDVLALEGDAGARALFCLPKFQGRIMEEDGCRFVDVDTPEMFEQAKRFFLSMTGGRCGEMLL